MEKKEKWIEKSTKNIAELSVTIIKKDEEIDKIDK